MTDYTWALAEALAQRASAQKGVVQAGKALLSRYQAGQISVIKSDVDALAYGVYRMPATAAAIKSALMWAQQAAPWLMPNTVMDIGAGTGAGLFASASVFAGLQTYTMLEQNAHMAHLAEALGTEVLHRPTPGVLWAQGDARRVPLKEADLYIAAYALIECGKEEAAQLLQRMWQKATMGLIVIEPGTPEGFLRIEAYKRVLYGLGAHMLAPCAGPGPCPLSGIDDFCHFSVRVQRSKTMMMIKEAPRSFEDEKFIFLAAGKQPAIDRSGKQRVVRRIEKQPGTLRTRLCGAAGVRDVVVRKKGEGYPALRHAKYGDLIEHIDS